MKFNGTALPNTPIEIIIENPLNKEIFSNIFQVDESGFTEFEYQTEKSSMKGTYTIIINQKEHRELIFTGIGELPTIPIKIEFDKINYKSNEVAKILLTGEASEILSLLIIDPSDKPKEETISITLQPDGRATHKLDLANYSSGVYTAVISKGSTQNIKIFTVGLQTGSGEISISTTKQEYLPGDAILILGETGKNNILIVSLLDQKGNVINEKEIFSDKNGKISSNVLRIPADAQSGKWTINAKSGSNFSTIPINIIKDVNEGMIILIEEGGKIPSVGEIITIKVTGVQQTVEIMISSSKGEIIDKLSFPASDQGEINLPWIIPKNIESGTYTISITDAYGSVQKNFEIK